MICGASNPVVWRERLHRSTSTQYTALTFFNGIGAAALIAFMHVRLLAHTDGLLPMWGWWSLAALMAGTAYYSYSRIAHERARGTLELLRSTPLVPRLLLQAQVRLSLTWMTRAIPLWALWVLWLSAGGLDGVMSRLCILLPLVLLLAVAGSLVGVRLALSPRGNSQAALGGALAVAGLVFLPGLLDATTGLLQAWDYPATTGLGPWNFAGQGLILSFLMLGVAWLWHADLRALSGFEAHEVRSAATLVGPLWQGLDGLLLRLAAPLGLVRNPFFMRERARSLRRLSRSPVAILTAVVPTFAPLLLTWVLGLTLPAALAWSSLPLIFLWWMGGAEMTREAMTNELDGRTLDSMRVSPLFSETVLRGMVCGRLYPFILGWVFSLPVWAWYACQTGVSPAAIGTFTLVLLGVGFSSAVGGLRGSCNSLGLKGEERHYSQAVSNAALWAWPLFTPIGYLFIVLPLHGILESAHMMGAFNSWVPLDILTLFPTWFVVPDLLPWWTFLFAALLHACIIFSAVRKDLDVAWDSITRVLCDDLPKA